MRNSIRQRVCRSAKAAGAHLLICIGVATGTLAVIFLVWYPGALAEAQGVNRLVLVLLGVDVALGPLITLVIYSPEKKSLKFDLGVVATLQTVALIYGMRAIYAGHPAYIVFNVDRFDVVAVQEINSESLALVEQNLVPSWTSPKWVAAELPTEPEKRSEILMSALQGGADLPQLPEYYVPLAKVSEELSSRVRPIKELRKSNDLNEAQWQEFLSSYGEDEKELGYLPLRANAKDGVVILEKESNKVLGIQMLEPVF